MNILELSERQNGWDLDQLSWFLMQYDGDPPFFEVFSFRYQGVRKCSPDAQS